MRPIVTPVMLCVSLFWCGYGFAQTAKPPESPKILIDSFVISGTRAIDSAELADITNSMAGSTFNDDSEELQERIRAQFQDRGYFQVEIKKLDIKPIDPLGSPKPVRMEAEVDEGPLSRLSAIEFTGNHAVTSQELRAAFPMKTGDVLARRKIASGLESLRKLYGERGFLDSISIPDTKFGTGVALNVEVIEGPQYRMDKLEVTGPDEVAQKLQVRWKLDPGSVFDNTYLDGFLEKYGSLLPADFTRQNGVELFENCKEATVSVHLHLTQDAQHAAQDRTKHVDCPPPDDKQKK